MGGKWGSRGPAVPKVGAQQPHIGCDVVLAAKRLETVVTYQATYLHIGRTP